MLDTQQHTDRLDQRLRNGNTAARSTTFIRHRCPKKSLKYRNFKRQILADLRSGRLQPGDLLPTVLQMSAIHGIAPNTIRRAFIELDEEGIIRRVRGKGTFIRDGAHQQLPRRLDVLGLIVNETIAEPYPALFQGLEKAAEKMHSQVLLSNSYDAPDRQGNIILQMLEKRVAGMVIVPSFVPSPPHQIRLLQENDIPVVCCHRRVEGARTPLVALPFREISRLAGQTLIEHGHRNIAMILGENNCEATPKHIEGMRDAVLPAGGTLEFEYVDIDGRYRHDRTNRERQMAEKLKALLAEAMRPTALMFTFDTEAELAYLILTQMGLRIPEDISLISFGGKARKGAIINRLTSVTVDGTQTGSLAGKLIEEMLDGKRDICDTEEYVLDVELHRGETLRRV